MTAEAHIARLRSAEWLRRADVQALLRLLDGTEGRTRAVGGIVRDTILDRPRESSDIDLATELVPQEVAERAAGAGAAVYPTGIEHGTLTIRLGNALAEVTTLREDVATDGRHAVVRFGSNWAKDASRRDFTLNALYAGMDGGLFDPLDGLADCLAGRVRFIGDPALRIAEDRLRVYRFFRFSASHGGERLDPAGLAACQAAAGQMDAVSAERIGAEMRRMLGLPRVAAVLKAMREAQILALGAETVRALQVYERRARRPDLAARLALIMVETGADALKQGWRLSNEEIASAQAILSVAGLVETLNLNEAVYRHPGALADGIAVASVLAGWTEAALGAVLERAAALEVPQFPLRGADLVDRGLQPGRRLGAELERLERLWIESGFSLGRDELLGLVDPR